MNDKIKWYRGLLFSKGLFLIYAIDCLGCDCNASADKDIVFSRLEEEGIDELIAFHDTYCINWNYLFSAEDVKSRLGRGHRCYMAHKNKHLVGFLWVAFESVYSPDLLTTFQFQSRCFVTYNEFIQPNYRGKNILPSIKRNIFQELVSEGYKKCFNYVRADNISEIRSNKKIDASVVGTIACGYFLGYYFVHPSIKDNIGITAHISESHFFRWKSFLSKIYRKPL